MLSDRDRWIIAKFSGGEYEVTREGILISHNSYRGAKRGPLATTRNSVTGYMQVGMWEKLACKSVLCLVHRIVALIHIPNPLGLPEVNHRDGDKANNKAGNLEWATYSGNLKHAYVTGLRSATGERNGQAKINEAMVRRVRLEVAAGYSSNEIYRTLGVTIGIVKDIRRGATWRHVA